MDRERLLRLMDENFVQMYREHVRHVPGGEVHEVGPCTVIYAPRGETVHNPVMVHGPTDAAEVLEVARAHAASLGRKHAVFTRGHADAHLDAGLEAAGYRHVYSQPGMVLMAEEFRPSPSGSHGVEVRAVSSDEEALAYGELVAEAFAIYGVPEDAVRSFFERRETLSRPDVQAFLGYFEGEPVTAATLYASHGVAGIGWVGTRRSHFGRRLAEVATSAALEEGFRRGLALANLQASPLGQRVYQRMGFSTPTEYKVFVPLAAA